MASQKGKRTGLKSPFLEVDTHCSYRMIVKLRGFNSLNQFSWLNCPWQPKAFDSQLRMIYNTVRYQGCSFFTLKSSAIGFTYPVPFPRIFSPFVAVKETEFS